MTRLKTHVSVDGQQYGPSDGDLPVEVAERITNPDVWATGDDEGEPANQLVTRREPAGSTDKADDDKATTKSRRAKS